MSLGEHNSQLIRSLLRQGKSYSRVAMEAGEIYAITINAAQVRMIAENTEDDQKPSAPAASLDAIALAHENLNALREGLRDTQVLKREQMTSEGKSEAEIRVGLASVRCAWQSDIQSATRTLLSAITAFQNAGGNLSDLDQTIEVHYHESEPILLPTPTPRVQ